ncbi:hypothetical protein NST28_16035 [Paenibacillus sp. FSL R10-2791]|uniref:hypothetical protein n=1 Tax=Paenibacillus sp. FSL R10-2791 TaxID=2954695 RepID=UPI0030FCB116
MIPNDDSLILFKVGAYKWMEKIKEGTLSFGALGSFIEIARANGNEEQGDRDEAIFARLKVGNPKIQEMKDRLVEDLEIIKDADPAYVKLRRKSSYLIPTFCLYSYRGYDLLDNEIVKPGKQRIAHFFDNRIFSAFADDKVRNVMSSENTFSMLVLQAANLKYKVLGAALLYKKPITIKHVNYTEFEKDEFFIEPTDNRDELFYKFPKYAYQYEARICMVHNLLPSVKDRLSLYIGPIIENKDGFLIRSQVSFSIGANIVLEKDDVEPPPIIT